MVKSSTRTLELLEYFALYHRPATVMELARWLGAPQSSTSVLAASLAGLGYLSHDPLTRTYRPTMRVLDLGAWLQEALFGDGALIGALSRLHRQTGQTVVLGMRQEAQVRYVFALRGRGTAAIHMALRMRSGATSPLALSAIGIALLAAEEDAEIGRIWRRGNSRAEPGQRTTRAELWERVQTMRRQGWFMMRSPLVPECSVIAARLAPVPDHPPMAVGVVGETTLMAGMRADILAAFRDLRTAAGAASPEVGSAAPP